MVFDPIVMNSRSFLQRGQMPAAASSSALTAKAGAPQCPQNLLPTNIRFRHFSQPTVFSRDLQYSHCVLSLETPLPQFGQFNA
jgi:hypothetical protein